MRHLVIFSILALTLCTISPSPARGQTTILGILEEQTGTYAGDSNHRIVRVVFEKKGDEWQAFQSDCPDHDCGNAFAITYPNQITWTIAFDGKNLGQVTSGAPEGYTGWRRGQQTIISSGPVPTIGSRTMEFMDASVYRPLIANSEPYFKDPEVWKPYSPVQKLIVLFRQAFRKQFPKLCRISKTDDSKLEPFPYRDDEIAVAKGYSSKLGWVVARMHLPAIDCEDVEAGFDIDDPWYAVAPNGSVSYLGSGLQLVDAGDYDNDGKSELVFAINRDNRGGYVLFWDNFNKRAVFEFGYH